MLTLEVGDVRAGIAPEAGGRLGSLLVGGRELLLGPSGPDDRSIRWGCFLMAPWPGRLAGGQFAWQGRTVQLPKTHGRNAIHGLMWDQRWVVETSTGDRATLACDLPAAWPMGGIIRETFRLTADRLTLDASITAGAAMPAALGWHPWFDRAGEPVALRVDAEVVQETERMLPTGRLLLVSGSRDLRQGPLLGSRRLDHAYMGARSPAVIEWPGLRLSLTFEPAPGPVIVHTPARGVCVEPQTAAPNALAMSASEARRTGVRFLAAGETMAARLELGWERHATG